MQKINADTHPKAAIEPPAKPLPLEVDDFQLVERCGSNPPMATGASLRSGKDAPTPNWATKNRFDPLAALEGMDQVRSTTRTSRTATWLWLGRGRSMRG